MNIEEKFESLVTDFKSIAENALEESIGEIYTKLLPHTTDDTLQNVSIIAEDIVEKLLCGDCEQTESGIKVIDKNGIACFLSITPHEYDKLREALLKAMPVCPKDLEIEALKKEIETLRTFLYRGK